MTEPDTDKLVLIVVGAHIRAEFHDRAVASRLRDAVEAAVIAKWRDANPAAGEPAGPTTEAP